MVKLSICLWDTRETFKNNDKQNIFGVSCCCRLNKENENRITRIQTRACNDVFYTKTYEKELRWRKSYLGERNLNVNSQIFHFIRMGLNIRFKQFALILIFEYTYIQNCIERGNRIISHSLLSPVRPVQKKSSSSMTWASRRKSFVTSL